jgi:hypothetical protein
MSYLNTYLQKFESLQSKLQKVLGADLRIHHAWFNDGCSSCGWAQGDLPKPQPDHNAYTDWNPQFTLRGPNYALHGRLDDDGGAPYWVLDLKIFHKDPLNPRKGFRGPSASTEIQEILEEDLPQIPQFLADFSRPEAARSLAKKAGGIDPLPEDKAHLNRFVADL